MTTRPDAWEQWFRSHDVRFDNVHGMLFDQFTTIAEAASVGVGVSLIPSFMIEEELRSGRLVAAVAGRCRAKRPIISPACRIAPGMRRLRVSEAGSLRRPLPGQAVADETFRRKPVGGLARPARLSQ